MNVTDRLRELMVSYQDEAQKCQRGKAYLAATVMRAAAFEAGLQAMCFFVPRRSEENHRLCEKALSGQALSRIGIFFEPTDQHCGRAGLVSIQAVYLGWKAGNRWRVCARNPEGPQLCASWRMGQ